MADQQITISFPDETLYRMQARVDSGEYSSLRDLILDCVDEADSKPLDQRYFGEDFETWVVNNRELLLRESEDIDSHIPVEKVLARYTEELGMAKPAA